MVRTWLPCGRRAVRLGFWLVLLAVAGCRGGGTVGTTDPEVKLRLERLLEFYVRYAGQKGKGPPNEQAFKEFIRNLPKEERDQRGIGDDVDRWLISPRDGQKYVVRYNLAIDPSGATQAVAWEQTGSGGNRYVALSVGYVEEYDEQSFRQLKK